MPFSFQSTVWQEFDFWLGLVFVTFPLNYLVYGLNDYNDFKADAVNARKGNFLFGAKSSQEQLQSVPKKTLLYVLPFALYFTVVSGWRMLVLLIVMVLINMAYNFKPFRIKERPPFEIFIQVGYVLTAVFSVLLNKLPILSWQTLLYLCLFAFQAHIAGEIMDIEPDNKAGKRTTATIIGRQNAKLLMLVLLLVETVILYIWFNDVVLAGFLACFSLWLLIDVFVLFKGKPYTVPQMKLFGYAMNVCALFSMLWILYSEKLLNPVF